MKIAKIGALTAVCGILAVGVSHILGAGPCNATGLGIVMMMLGLLLSQSG